MRKLPLVVLLGWLFAFGLGSRAVAHAATPAFTLSLTNVTMPGIGSGSLPFTLTSVNGYAGTLTVGDCIPVSPPVGARLPICHINGPVQAYALTADGSVTGNVTLIPYGENPPEPASVVGMLERGGGLGVALASAWLLGFGPRRRRLGRIGLCVAMGGILAGASCLGGCADNTPRMTPGTYAYSLTATDVKTMVSGSATGNVTVP